MPETIKNPVSDVFEHWKTAMEAKIGVGNCSMDSSSLIAKAPYARLQLMSNPGYRWDLEGNENATTLSFQAESFADGQKALTKVYDIDDVSHKAMASMGFRRTYGPELIENADKSIKRVVSRYSRVYTGFLF